MIPGKDSKFFVPWGQAILIAGSRESLIAKAKGGRTWQRWRRDGVPLRHCPVLTRLLEDAKARSDGDNHDPRVQGMLAAIWEVLAKGDPEVIGLLEQGIKTTLRTARALRSYQPASGRV